MRAAVAAAVTLLNLEPGTPEHEWRWSRVLESADAVAVERMLETVAIVRDELQRIAAAAGVTDG